MSTFRVTMTQPANGAIEVDGDTPGQAMASAEESFNAGLCHHCSREIDLDSNGWVAYSAVEVSS